MKCLCMEIKELVRRLPKKRFEELMVFMKGFIGHIPFESGTYELEEGTELVAGLEDDLFEIVSWLENEKSATSFQNAARKNEV